VWPPRKTIDWFEERGVVAKVESDGRIFPDTDDSKCVNLLPFPSLAQVF
jgi:predicted flavoprotein YhiN